MATIIENVIELVIEDPVVDIFVDLPGNGSNAASWVPSLKSGPPPAFVGVLIDQTVGCCTLFDVGRSVFDVRCSSVSISIRLNVRDHLRQ